MDLGPQDRASIVTHEVPDLAELVGLVRAGHTGAAKQLHRILSPGVRFLLQRRLDWNNVDCEAESVLEAAIRTIQTDTSLPADGVPQMVRRLIQQQCPGQHNPATETGDGAGPTQKVVEGILDGMSPCRTRGSAKMLRLGRSSRNFLGDAELDTPRISRHSSASQGRIQLQESQDQCCIILHVVLPAPEAGGESALFGPLQLSSEINYEPPRHTS
jgi:hypothetical protein